MLHFAISNSELRGSWPVVFASNDVQGLADALFVQGRMAWTFYHLLHQSVGSFYSRRGSEK